MRLYGVNIDNQFKEYKHHRFMEEHSEKMIEDWGQVTTPQAIISNPDAQAVLQPDTPVSLQGFGYDVEDGFIEDNLRWTLDQNTELGVGTNLHVSFSYGQHEITLTVTDKDGNQASAEITIIVENRVNLPMILRR
jgi:hypothetical protein